MKKVTIFCQWNAAKHKSKFTGCSRNFSLTKCPYWNDGIPLHEREWKTDPGHFQSICLNSMCAASPRMDLKTCDICRKLRYSQDVALCFAPASLVTVSAHVFSYVDNVISVDSTPLLRPFDASLTSSASSWGIDAQEMTASREFSCDTCCLSHMTYGHVTVWVRGQEFTSRHDVT